MRTHPAYSSSRLAGFVVNLGADAPQVFRIGNSRQFNVPLGDKYVYGVIDPLTGVCVAIKDGSSYFGGDLEPFHVYCLRPFRGAHIRRRSQTRRGRR